MLGEADTRLLGLRGLFAEAGRAGNREAAQHYAEEAARLAPAVPWSATALLQYRSESGDWEGALRVLEANTANKVVDKAAAKRLRAVLLTARARELEDAEPDTARTLALEAHRLAPNLVPAGLIAARLLIRASDIRRASRVLEATWKDAPHPDVAELYAHVRPGDSPQDRLKRVRALIQFRAHHVEGALALARAALDARDFAEARAALQRALRLGATERVCLMLAELEEAEHGDTGRVREWLARAVRAPRDPAWTADGIVAEDWAPLSPVTGRLDAFEWKVPVERLPGSVAELDGDALAGLAALPPLAPEPKPVIDVMMGTDERPEEVLDLEPEETATAVPAVLVVSPPTPQAGSEPEPAADAPAEAVPVPAADAASPPARAPIAAAAPNEGAPLPPDVARPKQSGGPSFVRMPRPPDDPGVAEDEERPRAPEQLSS